MALTKAGAQVVDLSIHPSTPWVSPMNFGAVGDGVADDRAALQAAIDSIGTTGGSVNLGDKIYLVDTVGLTVPSNVTLMTVNGLRDSIWGSDDILGVGGHIILNPSFTITLDNSSSISGVVITRKGLILPDTDDDNFLGTAITATTKHGICIGDCIILGFLRAIDITGGRQTFSRIKIDCTNGIKLTDSHDCSRFHQIHCWPFVTVGGAGANTIDVHNKDHRDGIAFELNGGSDVTTMEDCFSYGYTTGFYLNGSPAVAGMNSIVLDNCSADDVAFPGPDYVIPGTIGFHFTGTQHHNKITNCLASAKDISLIWDPTDNDTLFVNNFSTWSGLTAGIRIENGYIYVNECKLLAADPAQSLIAIENNGGTAQIDNNYIENWATGIDSTGSICHIGKNTFINNTADVVGSSIESVASAATLTVPSHVDAIHVTGTTDITQLDPTYAGHHLTLIFADILRVVAALSNLKIKGDFDTGSGAVLHLVCNGIDWFEMGRSSTYSNYFNVKDEKAVGTPGGTFTAGNWETRELTTVYANGIPGASLLGNQITLPAGTYRIFSRAPAWTPTAGIRHQSKLYNITDAANELIGSSCMGAGNTADESQQDSVIKGEFTITDTKVLEIQHRISSTVGTNGFGFPSNFDVNEIYTDVEIWKIDTYVSA